ncbi:MAG: FecR domain-containing protein [Deltaproteobacteria bacterium]|nr:FecR domain-containing protein [Deltaproteobacteria bacterium]
MSSTSCFRFEEDLVGLLEGTASESLQEHVASCDACRDARHELESVARLVGSAGDDARYTPALAERLATLADEAEREATGEAVLDRVSETRVKDTGPVEAVAGAPGSGDRAPSASHGASSLAAASGEAPRQAAPAPRKSRKALWLLLAACASIGTSAVVGLKLADRQRSPEVVAQRAWHGKVAKISRSGADKAGGLSVTTPSGKIDLGEGAEVKAGMKLATDGRTRARIELDDGSFVVLDRATEITVDAAPRTVLLDEGSILADVATVANAPGARVKTPAGEVRILGTKLAVTSTNDRMNVEVLRGEVEVAGSGAAAPQKVSAGQEGVVTRDGKIDIAPANDLAQRAAFGEQLVAAHNEDTEAPASGLGELRAKKPGSQVEKDQAVRLAKHSVKIRIAGNVARTEVDEEFFNDTNDVLEGIYRFPLPHGAQIERLALEVDGKLVDGEFIDKAKAAAIWRGAIQNAAPRAPRPREEIVWVPGPWHDPALLEWARGGRFELKIFPIPKKGSRRVVIAYTEAIAPVAGVRRYTYPLPQGSSSKITIDQFTVDAQVLGHETKHGVHVRGYELEKKTEGAAERLTTQMTGFTPSGDLAIEYNLDDRATDVTAWGYRAPAVVAAPTDSKDKKKEIESVGNDPYVAIALRPKLPKWADTKPRDQVIVVDSGRAMFGERFARAKRLAVQIAQEMDRRDRITVLACDVSCKALPAGFSAPGAPAAHDVDAFLAGITPDGASDLVGAVRAASNASGHDRARDLRVVVVSDGVATAGYRSGGRIAAEVAESMGEARAEVVTVPIGADADVNLLGEVARGGGGVVVPYQPGQRLETTALEVLNATYGTTLRDVELVLPEGLHDTAPAALAPIRAGSETIVAARMSRDAVKGEIVLRGKVGGDPFEAKYPIDVSASTDAGNAFVPRLFAAARIADRERDATDAQKTELVALSRRFAVPSRFTSLLVLESEAMFKAFGIERSERGASWTGEVNAHGSTVATLEKGGSNKDLDAVAGALGAGPSGDPSSPSDELAATGHLFGDDKAEAKKDSAPDPLALGGIGSLGHGAGGGGSAGFEGRRGPANEPAKRPAPTATMAPGQVAAAPPAAKPKAPESEAARSRADLSSALADVAPRDRRGGRFMRKIFVRRATIATDPTPAIAAEKIREARAAVDAAPDERGRHRELAKLLALSGQLDELGETLEKWSTRDPLDADVILARADLAARRGDREGSLRILGGALAASAMSREDAFVLASTVARSYDRAGKSEACAFFVTAAELKPTDVDAVARAVSCERRQGRAKAADRWMSTMKDVQRTAVTNAIPKIEAAKAETAAGDFVVSATWDGGADLDIAVVDPAGRRAGVATRLKGARIEAAQARDHESLSLQTSDAGSFVIEMVRAGAGEANERTRDLPVSGKVTIRAYGQTREVPFTLTGARTQVARVDARWEAELVPLDDDGFGGVGPQVRTFDRTAAASALANVSVRHCGASGQVGTGHVVVTFGPSGRVTEVVVDDPTFAGTPAGRCAQAAFFGASVQPFSGQSVRVGKSFTIR